MFVNEYEMATLPPALHAIYLAWSTERWELVRNWWKSLVWFSFICNHSHVQAPVLTDWRKGEVHKPKEHLKPPYPYASILHQRATANVYLWRKLWRFPPKARLCSLSYSNYHRQHSSRKMCFPQTGGACGEIELQVFRSTHEVISIESILTWHREHLMLSMTILERMLPVKVLSPATRLTQHARPCSISKTHVFLWTLSGQHETGGPIGSWDWSHAVFSATGSRTTLLPRWCPILLLKRSVSGKPIQMGLESSVWKRSTSQVQNTVSSI